MPRFNERRGDRRDQDSAYYGDRDQPRRRHEDGPWSPYNGGQRSFERSRDDRRFGSRDDRRFDPRGREYWRENEDESPRVWHEREDFAGSHRRRADAGASRRWDARSDEPWNTRSEEPWDARSDERWRGRVAERETRRDPWRYREHLHDPITEGEPRWGNEMGLRSDQPSDRSIPRGPDWQSEPRPRETWIARDERYRDDRSFRGEHRDDRRFRDERRHRNEPHGPGRVQTRRDTRSREAGGEQYPSHGSWLDDQDRGWRGDREYARELRERDQRDYDRGQREYGRDTRGPHERFYSERRDQRGREQRDMRDREQREMRDREMRDRERRDIRDRRQMTDEPGHDIGALHTDQGWMSRREYGVEGRDFRAEQSHELRRDRGEPWHGSETRGTDEYGRGLEQRNPEDRFRPENREWAMRISGRGDRGGRH